MADLGELKTRIISETQRDDLADDMAADLNVILAKSIEQYAAERWWFNEARASVICTPGNAYVPVPTGYRWLDAVWVLVGGVRSPLQVRDRAEIDALYSTPQTGQPTDYAFEVDQLYLWPTPNQAWTLLLDFIRDLQPPLDFTDAAASNFWTNQGSDLVTAQAKIRLYRDYLSAQATDPRLVNAVAQELDAYSRLRAESSRKTATGTVRPGW